MSEESKVGHGASVLHVKGVGVVNNPLRVITHFCSSIVLFSILEIIVLVLWTVNSLYG